MGSFNNSQFPQVELGAAATAASHAIRKSEHDAAIAGRAPASHTHGTSDVTGLAEMVQDAVAAFVVPGNSIQWTYDDNTNAVALNVKLGAGSGLALAGDGLVVAFGSGAGQVAAGNHTHTQLHDEATVLATDSIAFAISGQQVSGTVKLDGNPSAGYGGLSVTAAGLRVNLGSGANQAAAGNHTHTQLHDAATVLPTDSIAFTILGQQVSGTVKLDGNPSAGYGGLSVTASGLRVNLGSGANQAAAGNHTHTLATQTANGMLSASDKRKLDGYTALQQVEYPVTFSRPDVIAIGDYVGGKVRFGQQMQLVRVNVTAAGPVSTPVRLALEVDGVAQADTITIPAGSGELSASATLTNVFVAADAFVRWKCDQGIASSGALEGSASRIDLQMNCRAALGSVPEFKINCGGGEESPFATDQFSDGGSTSSTASAINMASVTNPAPEAVYRTARTKYNATSYPLSYVVTGLGRGVSYKVRCHFAEFYWNNAGEQVFDIQVTGSTVQTQTSYDILVQAGAKFKAVVREFTVMADSNGQIRVRLTPQQGAGGLYHCAINGLEIIQA